MPHIYASGCHMEMNLQQMNVHVELVYKKGFYQTPKQVALQKQILAEIEAVVEKYFGDIESEELTNHEYNLFKNT